MPENTPMKMYYQTINGRQVPVYYPQYWSEELGDWVISSEQNRLPVDAQLTGSNVELRSPERDVLITRSIRNSPIINTVIEVPPTAKGAYIEHAVYGVTGTFENGEGHELRVIMSHATYGSWQALRWESDYSLQRSSDNAGQGAIIYPGASQGGFEARGTGDSFLVAGIPAFGYIRIDLNILGTFEEGEGIDSEVMVQWLY